MPKTTTPLPVAQLYYSDVVCNKLSLLAADGSPRARLRIAQQHAVVLGLALLAETSDSLAVGHIAMPNFELTSNSSPFTYSVVLTKPLTHIATVSRSGAHFPTQSVRLSYTGVAPDLPAPKPRTKARAAPPETYDKVYDPSNNDWLYSHMLAPLLARRYTLGGAPCTVRECLQVVAAMSDAELRDDLHWSSPRYDWLSRKGFLVRSADAPAPDRLLVNAFPNLTTGNKMRALLEAVHGVNAYEELREYAGAAGHAAPNGDLVIDFVLHRAT
jgi:hypothetical protein